jgi:hypothetical protein
MKQPVEEMAQNDAVEVDASLFKNFKLRKLHRCLIFRLTPSAD